MNSEQKGSVKLADVLAANEEQRFFLPAVDDIPADQITGRGRMRILGRVAEIMGKAAVTGVTGAGVSGFVLITFGGWGTPLLILTGASGVLCAGAAIYGQLKD